MRFTERELTVALEEVAKAAFAASLPRRRRGEAEEAWRTADKIEKYQLRAGIADTLLPVLQELPERPTVGEPPPFTDEEYAEAASTALRAVLDNREPGAFDSLGAKQRDQAVRGTVELARAAVAAMPVRQDPDDLSIPDYL